MRCFPQLHLFSVLRAEGCPVAESEGWAWIFTALPGLRSRALQISWAAFSFASAIPSEHRESLSQKLVLWIALPPLFCGDLFEAHRIADVLLNSCPSGE